MQDEHLRKNMLKDLDIAIKVKRQKKKTEHSGEKQNKDFHIIL